jgi:hypothetical protein
MTDVSSVNGWTPPVVYDIVNDRHRVATQEDIDSLERQIAVFRALFVQVREAVRTVESAARHHNESGPLDRDTTAPAGRRLSPGDNP